jgi:hypothetical protein
MSKSAVLPIGKTPLQIITGSMMNRYPPDTFYGSAVLALRVLRAVLFGE